MKRMNKSRRHFLRGAGVALALPWMESLPLFGQDVKAAAGAANKPPVRFGCVYFSNGVEPSHWWAKGAGKAMEFGPASKPLAPIAEDLVFVKGLYNHKAFIATSPHLGKMANMLSGAAISMDPSDIRAGTTMDQVMSKEIGHLTPVPSMALGIEPNELRLEDGLSMIYGSCISWATPTKPATARTRASTTGTAAPVRSGTSGHSATSRPTPPASSGGSAPKPSKTAAPSPKPSSAPPPSPQPSIPSPTRHPHPTPTGGS
jgi:hypothetical protein